MEGLAIGGLTEGLIRSVMGVRAGRNAAAGGAGDEGIEKAVAGETRGGQEVYDAVKGGKQREFDETWEAGFPPETERNIAIAQRICWRE